MNANKEEFAYTKEINNATLEDGIITNQIAKRDIENAKFVFYIEKAIKRFIDILRRYCWMYTLNTNNNWNKNSKFGCWR